MKTAEKFVVHPEHWHERLSIKLEPYRNPTPLQLHAAENEFLEELRAQYGPDGYQIVPWPSAPRR